MSGSLLIGRRVRRFPIPAQQAVEQKKEALFEAVIADVGIWEGSSEVILELDDGRLEGTNLAYVQIIKKV